MSFEGGPSRATLNFLPGRFWCTIGREMIRPSFSPRWLRPNTLLLVVCFSVALLSPARTLLAQGANHILFGDIKFLKEIDSPHRIQGLKILLKNLAGQILRQQSVGIQGRYRFMDVANGDYVLVIEANGEEMVQIPLLINEFKSTDLRRDLELTWRPESRPVPVKARDGRAVYARSQQSEALFDQAQIEFEKSPETAAITLESLLDVDPADYEAWTELGSILFKQGREQEARKNYHKALSLHPDYVPALFNLGKLEIVSSEYDRAIDLLMRSVELAADLAEASYWLGEAHLQVKKGSKAVEYFRRALELRPAEFAEAHLRMATLYEAAGYPDMAILEYQQFLSKRPGSPKRAELEAYIESRQKP